MKGILQRTNKPIFKTHKPTINPPSQRVDQKNHRDVVQDQISPDELSNQASTIHITVRRHAAIIYMENI